MPKIHEQITKETWTKYFLHSNYRRCLAGWLLSRSIFDMSSVRAAIDVLYPERMETDGIIGFNDHPDTTFEDVLRVLKVADV